MKPINHTYLAIAFSVLTTGIFTSAGDVSAAPADQDKLRIHTGMPKKVGDSLFSYTVEWRKDDGKPYHATGMSFLNANKIDPEMPASQVTKKLVTAMVKDGMIQMDPSWRGITVTQPQDQAEMTIANKAGYSLSTITFKDYTNQVLKYDIDGKSFNAGGVQVAIDLVLAADVEYLDDFSAKKTQTASQGDIEITLDDQKSIHIKTDGKTTRELEREIAAQLSSSRLSETPLFAGIIGKDTRNNKPFDGSEVQLSDSSAHSVTIEITDPALGVLTKFKFKDESRSVNVVEPRFMLGVLGGISLLILAYFGYKNQRKNA